MKIILTELRPIELSHFWQLYCTIRVAVVEWLEWLGYGAESRRKVMSSRLGFAVQR